MGECIYSQRVDQGLDHYLNCIKTGTYCKYQKYCSKKKYAVNTEKYVDCSFLEKEGEHMTKTASIKKAVKGTVRNEETKSAKQEEKHSAYYSVLVATPNYYILDINGCPTKIFCSNNYKRGDIVER